MNICEFFNCILLYISIYNLNIYPILLDMCIYTKWKQHSSLLQHLLRKLILLVMFYFYINNWQTFSCTAQGKTDSRHSSITGAL